MTRHTHTSKRFKRSATFPALAALALAIGCSSVLADTTAGSLEELVRNNNLSVRALVAFGKLPAGTLAALAGLEVGQSDVLAASPDQLQSLLEASDQALTSQQRQIIQQALEEMQTLTRASATVAAPVLATANPAPAPQGDPAPLVVQLSNDEGQPMAEASLQLDGHLATTNKDGIAVFDAIRAGSYNLRVTDPAHNLLQQSLTVEPATDRQTVNLTLTTAVFVDWAASIHIEGLDSPAAGVAALLTPFDTQGSLSGPSTLVSDWEGQLYASHMPAGRYRLELTRSGFAPLQQDIEILPDTDAPSFQIKRLTQPVSVQTQVVDDQNQPVAGAKVMLAEAWPDGLVAEGTTGADGKLTLNGFGGLINHTDTEGRVVAARNNLTLHVEHDNFAPALARVQLEQGQASSNLTLTRLREQELEEPSADAVLIPGVTQRFAIKEKGQAYSFALQLPEAGLLTLSLPEENPIETTLKLLDTNGTVIQEKNASLGRSNSIEKALPVGHYRVVVNEWGNDNAAPESFTLQANLETAIDPLEPNDSDETATPVQLGEQIVGRIWPRGDLDHYSFQVERPSIIRIHGQEHPMEMEVKIRNAQGEEIQRKAASLNRAIDLNFAVTPGSYYIEVAEWGNDGESLTPYRLQLDSLADDGLDDPQTDALQDKTVRELAVNSRIGSTLLPTGDKDIYRIAVPGAGQLHIESHGRIERSIKLIDAAGNVLAERNASRNNPRQLSHFVEQAGELYVSIEEWGNDSWSADAYALSNWFDPADMHDLLQRNDTQKEATPVASGETLHGTYMPKGDQDFYVVEVDFPGYLRTRVQSDEESSLQILNSNGQVVAEKNASRGNAAELAPEVFPGTYYIRINEWGNDKGSLLPYQLSINLDRAEPEESIPLNEDQPHQLVDGEARAFNIDMKGDKDSFLFTLPEAGAATLNLISPHEISLRILEHDTNKVIKEKNFSRPARVSEKLELEAGRTVRVELNEWGNDRASLEPGFIMFDSKGRAIAADRLITQTDPAQPLQLNLAREAMPNAERARDCRVELQHGSDGPFVVEGGQEHSYSLTQTGLHLAWFICTGMDGQTSRQSFWIQATGYQPRSPLAAPFFGSSHVVDSAPTTDNVQVGDTSAATVTSSWRTSEGTLTMHRTGNQVNGRYTSDNGEILGEMNGNVLNGYWIEDGSNRYCETPKNGRHYWGRIQWTFTDSSFKGRWSYCDDPIEDNSGSWMGERQ